MHHLKQIPDSKVSLGLSKILIVDDTDSSRQLMKEILNRVEDYEIDEASNGIEALEKLKDTKYSIVITDVQMPQMDGITLLEKVKSRHPGTPVIIVTGFGSEMGPTTVERGADDCIYLPFRVEEFVFRVARVLRFYQLIEVREQLLEQNRELWGRAITDHLTGIYNRDYFDDVFIAEFERSRRYQIHLGMVMFDIDFFKKVNDEYGHPAGDQVLKELGVIIADTVRRVDIAARYGGEEFALILPETNKKGIVTVCNKLLEIVGSHQFCKSYDLGGKTMHQITVSIGAAYYPDEKYVTSARLLDDADKALYRAKQNGRNRIELAWE